MINITLKDSIKVPKSEKSLFLNFGYNANILDRVKAIKPRHWIYDTKEWEMPQENIHKLISEFGMNNLNVSEDVDLDYKVIEDKVFSYSESENDYTILKPIIEFLPQDLQEYVHLVFKYTPKYFFTCPASSSGTHHPSYAVGNQGLLKHVFTAGLIGTDLFENLTATERLTNRDKYLAITAILLHDICKYGTEEHVGKFAVDHPILASKLLLGLNQNIIKEDEVKIITQAIESHMGQWDSDFKGKKILPRPFNKIDEIVHMCDYLSSRKWIEVNYDRLELGGK